MDTGLMGEISEYFSLTGRPLLRSGICTGHKELSRTDAGYFVATPRKIYLVRGTGLSPLRMPTAGLV